MRIGNIEIDSPLCLAPMEDVTDLPFRLTCKELGADIVYTEFTHSEALRRNVEKAIDKIRVDDAERPVAVQIYGATGEAMGEAARVAESIGPDFIDINCGCWTRRVAGRGAGAGLLRDLTAFESVVRAVTQNTSLPVTVKTRLGWDSDSINILQVAPMLEEHGVAALTVHCRTRSQGYKGSANWDWLARLKESSPLPLIGNGDVLTPEDAERMLALGVDGIMIGRGAISNPWIFGQIKHYLKTGEHMPGPTPRERVDVCLRHLRRKIEYFNEKRACIEFRKHYSGYLKGLYGVKELRVAVMEFYEYAPIEEHLLKYVEGLEKRESEPDATPELPSPS